VASNATISSAISAPAPIAASRMTDPAVRSAPPGGAAAVLPPGLASGAAGAEGRAVPVADDEVPGAARGSRAAVAAAAWMAPMALSAPEPCVSAWLTWAGDSRGYFARISAATPAVSAAAMSVVLIVM
jgi:hypothetical protein